MIIEILEFTVGLILGGGIFIILAYGFGGTFSPKLSTALGRIMWTMGAMVNRCSVLEYTHGSGYNIRPMRNIPNSNNWEMWKDGTWESIDSGSQYISRLGKRPFGVVMNKEKQAFEDLLETKTPGKNVGDGENLSYGMRSGFLSFIPQKWNVRKDGWLISIFTLSSRLKLGASSDIANRSWIEALHEFADTGGAKFDLAHALFYLACLIIGVIGAWILVGGNL
tara:strand:- start:1867 stop:2535 length:669 start_codon:yes stop_codon:yes gene_type:complete